MYQAERGAAALQKEATEVQTPSRKVGLSLPIPFEPAETRIIPIHTIDFIFAIATAVPQ
jgi:hypothetical protein